ncbi:MAG: sulfatase-like hydrolase/transferase [Candidatus Omnitrophica bacterium]|nr:sulfatase-like hydrolase/transferase [Candidatus Omnitrophota bacterium]
MHGFLKGLKCLTLALSFSIGISSLLQGCSNAPAPCQGKNVLLISIDTCRADHIQPYADDKAQTPALKKIASEGIWFEDALTPVPLTLPAHCSLLTGLHPMRHGVRNNYNYVLSDEAVTLPELFLESGYATAGIIGSIIISRREGIGQGFDYFDDEFLPEEFQALQPSVERRAGRVIASATNWIIKHLESRSLKPFFLFLHFYDPHMIYQPPAPFNILYKEQPYDGEIAYVDICINQLVEFLKDKNLYDDLLLIVAGDHGEGLLEHGEPTHGLFLYEEAVRVPLITKLPSKLPRPESGAPCRQSVSLLDIMPTLIDLCGLGTVETDGESFAPWLLGRSSAKPRNLVLETQYPLTYNWSPMYSLRNTHWKYIHSPQPELYNLQNDPDEHINLISSKDAPLQEMQNELEDRLIAMAQSAMPASERQISSERMETLASLGYAAGSSAEGMIAPGEALPDPKEKLDVYLLVDRGLGLLSQGYAFRSIDLFEEALRKDPENPTPYVNLGLAYAKVNQWDKAIELTRKSVEMSPENLIAQLQLTRIYVIRDKLDEAQKRLNALIREFPHLAEAHFQLGEVFMKRSEFQSALQEYELAKYWMPDMPGIDGMIEKVKKNIAG